MEFDEKTLQKINALTLVAAQVRAGVLRGDRRSKKRGQSIEFADYRDYVPGDDLRRLDWNVYARLDRPFIKLFEEEEDLAVHLLLDTSKSMDWGLDEANKFHYAKLVCGALGSIALTSGDILSLTGLTEAGPTKVFGPQRGPALLLRYLTSLGALQSGGRVNLTEILNRFSYESNRPGLVFLVSDFLDPGGYESGVKGLLSRGHELVLIHILAQEEIDPPLQGDLRLLDTEYGYAQDVSVDRQLRARYQANLQAWLHGLQTFARTRGLHYLFAPTHIPWEQFILLQLRESGVAK